jgi:predicted membrane-bound dolichyl-phosphate-mannose-protein mannosyltransferase
MDGGLMDASEVGDTAGVGRWMLWSTGIVLVFVAEQHTLVSFYVSAINPTPGAS